MMKILMINLEIITIKTKSIQNTENDGKKIHFMDFKKVCFHKIVLDDQKEIHLMDFNQLHSFLIFIQIE